MGIYNNTNSGGGGGGGSTTMIIVLIASCCFCLLVSAGVGAYLYFNEDAWAKVKGWFGTGEEETQPPDPAAADAEAAAAAEAEAAAAAAAAPAAAAAAAPAAAAPAAAAAAAPATGQKLYACFKASDRKTFANTLFRSSSTNQTALNKACSKRNAQKWACPTATSCYAQRANEPSSAKALGDHWYDCFSKKDGYRGSVWHVNNKRDYDVGFDIYARCNNLSKYRFKKEYSDWRVEPTKFVV